MPRVSRKQASQHRIDIVDAAARLFRERGIDGVSVPELMADAGLTHGGFYGHFASKEELAALACTKAFADKAEVLRRVVERCKGDRAKTRRELANYYLASSHCDDPGEGCAIPALSSDIARAKPDSAVRAAYVDGVSAFAEQMIPFMEGRSNSEKRSEALAMLSMLVGAVTLARATRGEKISDDILKAVRKILLGPRRS
jgi:TetR/AcrR family transcriptional regulator, transcriptional repressor for nem operon